MAKLLVLPRNVINFATCLGDKHTFNNIQQLRTAADGINNGKNKMKKSKNSVLEFTTKFINQNFRIKVFGRDENGKKINTLVGVSGIIRLIGEELFNKFIKRALKAGLDACRCALRRGLVVTLYAK